jgi:hypothetical protein
MAVGAYDKITQGPRQMFIALSFPFTKGKER